MLPTTRFEAGDSRLGCADALSNFSLRDASGGASFKKFVEKLEFFVQSIIFGFNVCLLKGSSFKFFMS